MLKITLFNQFALSLHDQPLRPSLRPKTLELWAYLLLHQRESILRQTIAFELWPDTDDKTALTNCRRHLHHLRMLLAEIAPDANWLAIDNKSVRWQPDIPVWVDVIVFQQWAEGDATLADAVALYTGDLLQELYADWLFYERERYREACLTCLHRLIEKHAAQRDYPQAIRFAQQLLAMDFLREVAIRQLMRLLYQSGDRAGALAAYHNFVHQLRQELNVDPMDQTVELYQSILSNRPHLVGESLPATSAAPDASLPFVGRADEMQLLRDLWSRSADGKGHALFIGGTAGIGKSRLVDELKNLANGQGAWVLSGSTSFMEPAPQQAFVEALTRLLPAIITEVDDPQTLAPLTPFIAEVHHRHPGLKAISVTAQTQTKADVFAAFGECFIILTRTRPTLLVLEDFHWASAYTVELLGHLIRTALHRPLLIVVTYRPEDTTRNHPLRDLLRQFYREGFSTQIMLDTIDARAVGTMLTRLFGDLEGLDTITQNLLHLSDGNPLFIHELLQNYLERGVIQRRAEGWSLRPVKSERAPSKIQAIIAERLARLSDNTRLLSEMAAVVGTSFDLELVREVSGWGDDLLFDCLHELLDRGIIRESSGQGTFDYTFTHYLIRQTIYDLLNPADRQRRHRRIAHVMHEIYGADQAVSLLLAQHYDVGGMAEKAAQFYLVAAQRDHTLYAHQEALSHIKRALELTDETLIRFELLAMRERIEAFEGDRTAQLNTIEMLEQLAGQDHALLCSALLRRIRYLHHDNDQTAELQAITRLEQVAAGERWQAELALARGHYYLQFGDYHAAEYNVAAALERFANINDEDGLLRCYTIMTEIALHRGNFDDAGRYIQQMKVDGDGYLHTAARLRHLKHAGTHAFMAQQYQVSMGFFEELLADSRHYGDRQSEMVAHFYLAMTHARLTNILLADRHYELAASLAQTHGNANIRLALRINRGTFKAATGQAAEALCEFEEAMQLMIDAGDKRGVYTCVLNLSVLNLWLEDTVKARHFAEQAIALADDLDSNAYRANALSSLGFVERASGNYPTAINQLEQALTLRRQMGGQQTSLLEDLVELAVAHLEAGQRAEASHLLDDILVLLSDADHSAYNFQRVLWYAARLCRECGDTGTADRLVEEAHSLLQHQAQQLPTDQQQAYLNLPFNRAILNAIQR